jgi:hypothetical protein
MPYKDPLAQKAAQKAWYERNKKEVSRRVRDRRTTRRQYVRDYKLNNSICTDCGISYPPHMLDFDHLFNKRFTISGKGVKDFGLDAIIEEIKKCEIVCSNCHRHRTYMRSADVSKMALSSIG